MHGNDDETRSFSEVRKRWCRGGKACRSFDETSFHGMTTVDSESIYRCLAAQPSSVFGAHNIKLQYYLLLLFSSVHDRRKKRYNDVSSARPLEAPATSKSLLAFPSPGVAAA